MEIIIIAAVAENRAIGIRNALPWSLKEDMARFRELTAGWPCVMGRKTWESLPQKPLPGRLNIVVSRTLPAGADSLSGALVFPSLGEALRHCGEFEKVFICGGAAVYAEAIALADTIELTAIYRHYDGDSFFPEIDPRLWEKTSATDFDGFSFISYNKKIQETGNYEPKVQSHKERL
jgi:dihydrofolate reductase